MRISLDWISGLLAPADIGDGQALFDRLSIRLAEVDELERVGPALDGVVVGKVVTCEQHPEAERLSVTTVDVAGDELLPIVCGAPNVAAGQTVAVATIGTTLTMPGKDGEPVSITIKKAKLRGQPSRGMICAEDELGLGDSHDGIMVLDDALAAGTPLITALGLGDQVLVVDNHNINHRPDLWGHLGWAREIAACQELPSPAPADVSWTDSGDGWSVAIEDQGCRTYCGAVVTGVSNQPSPAWMQERLEAVGLRPLGLLVDITNYVMLELGQPMHAFDRRTIAGQHIVVRNATADEPLTTLDETELKLNDSDLLIADSERPLALAGIMGGAGSMVQDDTDTIVLEAAIFQAARIRRTRLRTGITTDSAIRFEKSLYPETAPAAINRAIALLAECCPGCEVTHRFHAGDLTGTAVSLPFEPALVDRYLGSPVAADRQQALLERLGLAVADGTISVPWWRAKDLSASVDLVEEIARLQGYEHLVPEVPRLPAASPAVNHLRQHEHRCRQLLSAAGWDEIASYVFTSDRWAEALEWPAEQAIRPVHPLASDQTVMRQDLRPLLLEAAGRNRRHLPSVQAYEIGKRYGRGVGVEPCVDERLVVAGVAVDPRAETPFYAARDALTGLLSGLGYPVSVRAWDAPTAGWMAGRCAEVLIDGTVVGVVGEVTQALCDLADLTDPAAVFVCELEELIASRSAAPPRGFTQPSRYQAVTRDFTFVCPDATPYANVASVIERAVGDLAQAVELAAPVFYSDQLPDGHKAISLRVTLQATDRTLSDKELTKAGKRIVGSVERQCGATLRS